MIASMLYLDRRAIKVLRVTDPYSIHRVVYSLFEDIRDEKGKNASQRSGILYVDQGGDFHGRKILILSDRPPIGSRNETHGKVESKPVPDDFLEHARYRFKVVVNPVRRDSASRKLVAIRGRDAVTRWITERAEKSWGFVPSDSDLTINKISVMKFKDKRQRIVTIGQAEAQGCLRVVDRERFTESFKKGIGRGRAFGCGLLQLVPITDKQSV